MNIRNNKEWLNELKSMKKKLTEKQKIKRKIEKKIKKEDNEKEIRKLKNKKPINFKKLNKNSNINNEPIGAISKKRRVKWELLIALFLLIALSIRIGIIQFVQGEQLQSMAYVQQTLDRNINPKRGTIYDATRKNSFGSKLNSRNSNCYTN